MKYEGNDKFISSVVNSLNQMGNDKLGEEVISTLSGSENHYTFTNSYAKDSEGNVVDNALQYNDATGEIHAAVLLNSNIQNSQKIESAAHELFHGYQAEFGERGSTINREVGAYLYGRSLVTNLGYGTLGFGDPSTTSGQTYNQAMNNLLFNFDQRQYNTAINTFKQGASVNVNGTYNRFIIKSNDSNPVIKKLYPLIR